jgi:hypothetical protein
LTWKKYKKTIYFFDSVQIPEQFPYVLTIGKARCHVTCGKVEQSLSSFSIFQQAKLMQLIFIRFAQLKPQYLWLK